MLFKGKKMDVPALRRDLTHYVHISVCLYLLHV